MRPSRITGMLRRARLAALGASVAAVGAAPAAAVAADPCPNAAIREQQGASHLPDCRAYQLVSPRDKAGHDVRRTFSSARASADGSAVTYTGFGSFPGDDGDDVRGAAWMSRYLARRGEQWRSRSIDSRQDTQILSFASLGAQYQNIQSPESFDAALTVSTEQNYQVRLDPAGPEPEPGVVNLYRRTYDGDTYTLISPWVSGPLLPALLAGLPEFVAATPDRRHIVFEMRQSLTADPVGPFDVKLYEWDDGELRLVGILPEDEGGGPANGGSVGAAGLAVGTQNLTSQLRGSRPGVMSQDGRRIFFLEGSGDSGRLFMREGNGTPAARTVWISRSEHTTPEPTPLPVTFHGATPSGDRVLFSSAEQLVDEDADAATDLYQYRLDAPPGRHLTRISAGAAPADVLGVVGAATGQERIYFVATGQLVPEAPADGRAKLYLADGGALRYVASLDTTGLVSDARNWDPGPELRTARVSDDGRYLLFISRVPQTDYDSRGFDELYLFDADASPRAAITCVSCRRDGQPPVGDAVIGYRDSMANATPYQPRVMTTAGGRVRVFFETYDRLDRRDGNAARDVYAYDHATGRTALLSAGTGNYDSHFMDADVAGDHVFITTRDRLSRWDDDPLYDLYDVAVGGDIPEPPAPSRCVDDECQPPFAPPPPDGSIGTADYDGPGNRDEAPRPRPRTPAGRVRVIGRGARGAAVVVRVRVPSAGRLVAEGAQVRRLARSLGRRGAHRIVVGLTRRARRTLAHRGRLRVVVRLRFTPARGAASAARVVLVIRRARR